MLRTRFANAVDHFVPGRFAGVHGGEAMFDERAFVRQFSLLVGRQILRGKLGVGHQDALQLHSRSPRTRAKISLRPRWPVAMIMS